MLINNTSNSNKDGHKNDETDERSNNERCRLLDYNGHTLYASDIKNKSTCADILRALNPIQSRALCIYENWKGIERPLDSRSILLDVYNAWNSDDRSMLTFRVGLKPVSISSKHRHKRSRGKSNWSPLQLIDNDSKKCCSFDPYKNAQHSKFKDYTRKDKGINSRNELKKQGKNMRKVAAKVKCAKHLHDIVGTFLDSNRLIDKQTHSINDLNRQLSDLLLEFNQLLSKNENGKTVQSMKDEELTDDTGFSGSSILSFDDSSLKSFTKKKSHAGRNKSRNEVTLV
ncbi:hypothetical protein GJ496_011458 [Pomphorhynchus laevis]|nr:hypothetical protein GJ496_011458 [Pomphorhynchus laevis]